MDIVSFNSRDVLMAAAAARLETILREAIETRGAACVALSGGVTPEPIYRALAVARLDWPKITLAMIDERFVPASDAASNQGMIERTLAPALAAGARLAPMYSEAADAEVAAENASRLYAPLTYDVALMGMGEDGHTASWFPHARGLERALDPRTERAVVAVHAPGAFGTPERLTLTRAALKRAARLLIVMTGEKKRAVLEGAAAQALPIAALFASDMPPSEVFWAP